MSSHLKKIVAVTYDCKMYANRLWNDLAIYAATRELDVPMRATSLLEHTRLTRRLYRIWAQFVGRVLHAEESMWAWGGTVRYLPPSAPLPAKYAGAQSLYLLGMLFRNPEGFKKYAPLIRDRFRSDTRTARQVTHLLLPLEGRTLIGVEIRQKPFTYFPEGDFLIPLARTREILDEYVRERGLTADHLGIVIASDASIPRELFSGYRTVVITNEKQGFHALTRTSVVVGTNSPTANLATWLANVPHIVTDTNPIDWSYYRGKEAFFDNKYATLTQHVSLSH
jgi:hypothetical protein